MCQNSPKHVSSPLLISRAAAPLFFLALARGSGGGGGGGGGVRDERWGGVGKVGGMEGCGVGRGSKKTSVFTCGLSGL